MKSVNHFHTKLEKELFDSQMEPALIALIESSLKSKSNLIPIVDNPILHDKILTLDFVKLINDKQDGTKYQLEYPRPPIFGLMAFNYLLRALNLTDPKDTNDLLNILEKFSEYFENKKEFRLGTLNVVRPAQQYALLFANFKYRENFSFITSVDSADSLITTYGDLPENLIKVSPYCTLEFEDILLLFDFFHKIKYLLHEFLASLSQYFDHNEHAVNFLINKISDDKRYANLVSLLLSKQHLLGKALSGLLTFHDPTIIVHALTLLSYQNDDEFSLALDYTVSSSVDPILKSRVLSKLLTIEWISKELKAKVVDLSKELILSCPNDSLPGILFSALAYTYDPNVKIELINELLDKSPDNFLQNISHLNNVLNSNIAQDNLPSILIKIISKYQNEKDIINCLKPVVYGLNQENLSKLITLILNDDSYLVNNKISEILLVKINAKNIILSKEILSDLSYADIKYIAIKSLAYVHAPENLTSIIYSISQVLEKESRTQGLIIDLFNFQILPVYRYPIKFLEQKSKTASEGEKELIQTILDHDVLESNKLKDSLDLKELKLPSWKFKSFKKMKFKKISEDEKLLPPTPILDLVTKVQLRAGRQFVFRTDESSYQRSGGMQQFTQSFEFPKLAIIDPVIYYKNINIFKTYKREVL
jgi:hypothetical protein